jgi:formate dehydrogenase subunit gamma
MAHPSMISAARLCIAALGLAVVCSAAAQSPAVSPQEADQARQQAAQQLAQPLNNQPVWNEVRTGQPQYTSIPGRETNILIQPQGQTWRAARVPLATAGGFLFAAALLALAVFYVWRGPITIHGTPTGRRIERFTLVERAVHWSVAITFTTLAVTGLILTFGKALFLPLIGYTLFSWLAIVAKNLHNFVGPILVILLPIMILLFMRENLFRAYDWAWLKKAGGMFSRTHVPAGKANAGQKILFWIMVVAAGLTLVVTGLILDFPNFNQTRATMQVANVIHMIAGLAASILLAGHIYLGTIGMKGALDAMRTGYVDETWAREHHEYWYNDVKPGKVPAGNVPDAAGQYAS